MFHILLAQCHADYWLTTKIKFDLGWGLLLAKGDKLWHHRWSCRWTVYIYMMIQGDYLQWYTICGDYWGGDQPQEKFQNKKSQ